MMFCKLTPLPLPSSGRLHPLWPQKKWLHTPRTTDYRHTRHGRWIQTELAFTLAKNATKPNPFEIIPLQTVRKENSWKTEEAFGVSSCNCGDGTDQRVQSLMFMMVMKLTVCKWILFLLIINYHLMCQKFTAEDHMLMVFGTGLANWSKMSSCNFEWKYSIVSCTLHICLCIVANG